MGSALELVSTLVRQSVPAASSELLEALASRLQSGEIKIEDGVVSHRRECRDCHGCGGVTHCRWHGGGSCPCARVWKCDECDGTGNLFNPECDCGVCELVAEALLSLETQKEESR